MEKLHMRVLSLALPALLLACGAGGEAVESGNSEAAPAASGGRPFALQVVEDLDEPWAMAFIPGTRQALITEKKGKLLLWSEAEGGAPGASARASAVVEVAGVPAVAYGGQGGLGDVALHPDFKNNHFVYLSWVEAGDGGTKGAVVGRARLNQDGPAPRLENMQIIWRQEPKVEGDGHFSHRLAFSPDGYLFITSGERQKFTPAQDMNQNLGKVIRLSDAGGVPSDNPYYDQGRIKSQIWSSGHRNLLGIAFAPDGRLWTNEMGPKGGDEVNLIERGSNYGYPVVSNGSHYSGEDIPDHDTRPEFNAPEVWWNPSISPSSMMIYTGRLFPQWRGSAFIGALSGKALIRVALNGASASKADQWDMGARIREVEQGPDGAIWLLEDAGQGSQGRLLKLTPGG
jgi:glucose/arabinose dehydrogenase